MASLLNWASLCMITTKHASNSHRPARPQRLFFLFIFFLGAAMRFKKIAWSPPRRRGNPADAGGGVPRRVGGDFLIS